MLDDPRRRFPAYAALLGLAALGWVLTPRALGPVALRAWIGAAVAARLWALASPPALSEDVFRFVYEGRVALRYGPSFAFLHPPSEAPPLGVDPALLDAAWLRINHADVPTLYPPLMQACFALGAALGGLGALKLLLVLAELGAAWLLGRRDPRAAVALLACPLAITEIAREGHAESLVLLGLAGGLATWLRGRLGGAGLGFAVATWAKLVGLAPLAVLFARAPRRAAPALALAALAFLPYAWASSAGLLRYASAWRGGDGAFALCHALAEHALGGSWASIAGVTVTRDAVARGLAGLAALACVALARREEGPGLAGLALLFGVLWGPTLHPWYALWLLPWACMPLPGAPAMRWLIAAAPLLHHPSWLALEAGQWTELGWPRALVHAPAWGLLLAEAWGRRRGSCSVSACP